MGGAASVLPSLVLLIANFNISRPGRAHLPRGYFCCAVRQQFLNLDSPLPALSVFLVCYGVS